LLIRVDDATGQPLRRQVFEQVRQAILEGRLRPGERLPSTRAFARRLGISRSTLCLAYEQLLAEGYVESRHGSGTYVSAHVPEDVSRAGPGSTPLSRPALQRRLSAWSRRLPAQAAAARQPFAYDFRLGRSAWQAFPWLTWRRLFARRLRQPAP